MKVELEFEPAWFFPRVAPEAEGCTVDLLINMEAPHHHFSGKIETLNEVGFARSIRSIHDRSFEG